MHGRNTGFAHRLGSYETRDRGEAERRGAPTEGTGPGQSGGSKNGGMAVPSASRTPSQSRVASSPWRRGRIHAERKCFVRPPRTSTSGGAGGAPQFRHGGTEGGDDVHCGTVQAPSRTTSSTPTGKPRHQLLCHHQHVQRRASREDTHCIAGKAHPWILMKPKSDVRELGGAGGVRSGPIPGSCYIFPRGAFLIHST